MPPGASTIGPPLSMRLTPSFVPLRFLPSVRFRFSRMSEPMTSLFTSAAVASAATSDSALPSTAENSCGTRSTAMTWTQ